MTAANSADSRFGPDGTADPPPPRRYEDPLAGLVTGGVPVTEDFSTDLPDIPAPVVPDQEAIRAAVEAALADEAPAGQRETRQPRRGATEPQWRDAPPPVPAQAAPVPAQAAPRQNYQRQQRQRTPLPAPKQAKVPERKKRSPGCMIILVLVLIVVFYNVFSSLASFIGGLFH